MKTSSGRWGIKRTPEGGISAGYTGLAGFRRCMRRGYWSLLHSGHGISGPKAPPPIYTLYGQGWHAAYRASWKGENILDTLKAWIASEGLEAEVYDRLCHEIVDDMSWYWAQEDRGDNQSLEVLACEEELKVKVGRHELRGTPDLIACVPSGSIVIFDHKTFGVLSYSQTGSPRIEIKPREASVTGYRASRQFCFYAALFNLLHPEDKCYDAMLNMVPSHITAVMGILEGRKGNVEYPKVKRIDLEPFSQSYLDELVRQTVRLCDTIADFLNGDATLAEALELFAENESACVGQRGALCGFYDLCRSDTEFRAQLLEEAFEAKPE